MARGEWRETPRREREKGEGSFSCFGFASCLFPWLRNSQRNHWNFIKTCLWASLALYLKFHKIKQIFYLVGTCLLLVNRNWSGFKERSHSNIIRRSDNNVQLNEFTIYQFCPCVVCSVRQFLVEFRLTGRKDLADFCELKTYTRSDVYS